MYNAELLDQIKKYFLTKKDEELCGLIIKMNNDSKFIECQNISKDKTKNFAINPLDYLMASEIGEIDCCVHSHPRDNTFSIKDINNSIKHNINYLLYNIKKDKFYFFDIEKYKIYIKYINLSFKLGYQDCATLIYNFFKNELGICLPIPPNSFGVLNYQDLKNKNLHIWNLNDYKDNVELFNIIYPKNYEDLKLYDIIIYNDSKKNPVHGAIYLENELILHQMQNTNSRIEGMRKAHFKFINHVARYKNI